MIQGLLGCSMFRKQEEAANTGPAFRTPSLYVHAGSAAYQLRAIVGKWHGHSKTLFLQLEMQG